MSKRFIEIQSFGNRHLINLDSLQDIEECEAGCELIFEVKPSFRNCILADETYDQIKSLIEEAEKCVDKKPLKTGLEQFDDIVLRHIEEAEKALKGEKYDAEQ